MNPAAIYDIETESWDTFALGALRYPDGSVEMHRDERSMLEAVLSIDGEVWAHNGSRFDHVWLLDAMQRHGRSQPVNIMASGAGIVKMQIGKTVLLDTMRVFPMSLSKLTKGAKQSLADLCRCGKEGCGGYCVITSNMPANIRTRVSEYLYADVSELWKACEHFQGFAESVGLKLGITVGSTAWKSARDELGLEPAGLPMNAWSRARLGYLGGRVEVFRRLSARGFTCDVNSMYPWAIATIPLPVDYLGLFYGGKAGSLYNQGLPGIYCATVTVPESFIPPLPVRCKTGIAYPTGTFSGTWPANELLYAETRGVKLERFHYGVVFRAERIIFDSWVDRLFTERMKRGKASREGTWIKWVCNSVTGKLGSKSEKRSVKVWPDIRALKACACRQGAQCRCGAYRPLDAGGRMWESVQPTRKPEACAHVEWAAYLTGAARVKLAKQLIAGPDDAVYCDTDSCYSEQPRSGLGGELGEWSPATYEAFESLGPKMYRCLVDGKETVSAKGIPTPNWETLKAGVPQKFGSMLGLKRGAQSNNPRFFERIQCQRTVTANTGRRIADGPVLTRAPRASEVAW
jgi:DNA polymerase family B